MERAHSETKEFLKILMYRNMKIGVFQVYGEHPIRWLNNLQDRLNGLHLEMLRPDKFVQTLEVDNRRPCGTKMTAFCSTS